MPILYATIEAIESMRSDTILELYRDLVAKGLNNLDMTEHAVRKDLEYVILRRMKTSGK